MNNAGQALSATSAGYNTTNQAIGNLAKAIPGLINSGGTTIGSLVGGP